MLEDLALQPLDTGTALSLWERADDLSQPRRALALLAAASARTEEELARMPLGRRDAALLRVHALTFGAALECVATCAGCGAQTALPFDAGGTLWSEAAASAQRLLQDVHALASAYHWSEADILALSPARRGYYLECLAG